ncbi:MAG TPA: metalloregulator ArsR/SmtB family transcription factor [Actinomycetota bacterium]|nr:metalloregulator ArsR/SmtB family transcription factor [Actinomycetota bacterium]
MTYETALDALGDGTRRAVLAILKDGPRSVADIAATLPVSRPAVSQHLKVLQGAGLVSHERAGTRRLYRVELDALGELRAFFDRFWDEALANFKELAEREKDDDRG